MHAKRLYGLDAIRGVCALLVLCMHSRFMTQVDPFPSAYLAVDIFFAMSGYVIALNYGERLQQGGYVAQFLRRRAARLLPMWIIGLGIGTIFDAMFHHHWPHPVWPLLSFAFGIFFVPVPIAPTLFPYNSPGWSLFYEAIANIFYATTIRRHATTLLVGLAAAGAALLIVSVALGAPIDGGSDWKSAAIGLSRVTFAFTIGILFQRCRDRIVRYSLHPMIFWGMMLMVVLAASAAPTGTSRSVYGLVGILIACPLVLFVGLNSRVGSPKLAEELGVLSYPLYATHFAIMMVVFYLYGAAHHWQAQVVPLTIGVPVVMLIVVMAYCLGRFVDIPAQRLIAKAARQCPVQIPAANLVEARAET